MRMDRVKGMQPGAGLSRLMAPQIALARRLREVDKLCPPCSTKISEAGWTGNRDVCADCLLAARPVKREE